MTFPQKPQAKPARPEFSSGPCPKHPEWSFEAVAAKAFLGRSHRASAPKAQLKAAIDRTAEMLGVPASEIKETTAPSARSARIFGLVVSALCS